MQKTFLITTGSIPSMGMDAAKVLAASGHRVLIAGELGRRASAALAKLQGRHGEDSVQGSTVDFSSLGEVRALARQVATVLPRIDGVLFGLSTSFSMELDTPEGLDLHFAGNVFAPYLLLRELEGLTHVETRVVHLLFTQNFNRPLYFASLRGDEQSLRGVGGGQSQKAAAMWIRAASAASAETGPKHIVVRRENLPGITLVKEHRGREDDKAGLGILSRMGLREDDPEVRKRARALDARLMGRLLLSEEFEGVSGECYDPVVEGLVPLLPAKTSDAKCAEVVQIIEDVLARTL